MQQVGKETNNGDRATDGRGGGTHFARAVKYGLYLVGAGYVDMGSQTDFFLSITSLHDGKKGFTSNERLRLAQAKAREYYASYHAAALALQLLFVMSSESMGDHDSGYDDWWCVG